MDLIKQTIETVFSNTDTILAPYGCKHYLRRCKTKAPCCDQKLFDCRRCHDEEFELDNINNHKLDPSTIKLIVCTNCHGEQEVSQHCTKCNSCFGFYYCSICKLFDDIDREQYHCDKCGICRIYKSKSFHCDKCNICLPLSLKDHICSDFKETYCPICLEYLFDSTKSTFQTKCGHSMHYICLMDLLANSNRCPVCSKSVFYIKEVNSLIDIEVEQTLMPDEYKDKKVDILCNDCNNKSNVNFHVVGMKCTHCGSYNSRQI